MIDQQLTHYEINAKIDEGRMGEAYRGTGLNRDVALMILPAPCASVVILASAGQCTGPDKNWCSSV